MKKDRTVLEAKRYGVHSCHQLTPLVEVCQLMLAEDISSLVIVDDEGYLAGIVSRTDLLQAYLEDDEWTRQPVQNLMSADVVTVTTDTTLLEVATLLLEHDIHRVVIVREEDGKYRPLGVVSDSDLIYHMVKENG